MKINAFSKHIFWSYNPEADLPDKLIIAQVVQYGELADLVKMTKMFSKNLILSILEELKNKNVKRVNFIKKVLL